MIGYQKSTTLGNEDCILVDPRACYRRGAPLSANWSRALVGVFFSLVAAGTENGDCTTESIPYTDFRDQISLGLCSGAGAPGMAGHRFVGMGCATSGTRVSPYWNTSGPCWWPLGNYAPMQSLIADGTSLVLGGGNAYLSPEHKAPSGTELFAAFLCVDITLTSTGATLRMAPNASASPYGVTNVSEAALVRAMFSASWASQTLLTGGWWSGGESGLTDFFFRFPHRNNRLRIHAHRVEQLA